MNASRTRANFMAFSQFALSKVSWATAKARRATEVNSRHDRNLRPEGGKTTVNDHVVIRQPLVNRLIHWGIAVSITTLFFSGFGQMPLYKRYMVADLPGMGWTADFGATLGLHYVGAILLLFAVAFHLGYHGINQEMGILPRRGDFKESVIIIKAMLFGGEEPPAEKYLAEQRLAYAFIGGNVLLLVVSGMVKVAKNLQSISLDSTLVAASTHIHNLAMVLLLLGIAGHMAAFLIPANRRLIPGMFHGRVSRSYAQHRHPLWYRQLAHAESAAYHYSAPSFRRHNPPRISGGAPDSEYPSNEAHPRDNAASA